MAAGLDESVPGEARVLKGRLVDLFDPELKVQAEVALQPGSRRFLLDLGRVPNGAVRVLASACKALPTAATEAKATFAVEGVANTEAVVLLTAQREPKRILVGGQAPASLRSASGSSSTRRSGATSG